MTKAFGKDRNEDLIKRYQNGEKIAAEELLRENYGFIRKKTSDYYYIWKDCRCFDNDDVISCAMIGFLKAAKKCIFDENTAFLSYADFYIFRELQHLRVLDNPIHIPTRIWEDYRNGRLLENNEPLFDRVKKATDDLINLDDILLEDPCLYSVTFDDDFAMDYSESIPNNSLSPEELAEYNESVKELSEAVSTLTQREQTILYLRFCKNMTYQAVGKEFNLTRERIRQIEQKSILKLKRKLKEKWRIYND